MVIRIIGLCAFLGLGQLGTGFAGAAQGGHGVAYPHNVTSDYVYRTPHVQQSRGISFPWAKLFGFGQRGTPIPAETGTELSLRVRELVAEMLTTSRESVAGELQLAVSTFVSLEQLYETSGLGRYLSEQMLHELQRAGVEVIEIRMMPSMKVSKGHGEYVLSRDMSELSYLHDVDAVVAGTYTVANGQIFLNCRLLAVESGKILSTSSTVFESNGVVASLLERSGQPIAPPQVVGIQSYEDITDH